MNNEPAAKPALSPAISLFVPGTRIIRDNFWTFLVLQILPFLYTSAIFAFSIGITTGRDAAGNETFSVSPLFWAMIIPGVIYTILSYAPLTYTYLKTAAGNEVGLREAVTKGLPFLLRLIGLNILIALMVIGGFILFIIPGFIVLRRYYLAPYYLIDRKVTISQALSQSARESKQFSWSIYAIFGIYFLVSSLTWFIPVLGNYISTVLELLYGPAPSLRYQEIKAAYKG
jgi:hypothetical protein